MEKKTNSGLKIDDVLDTKKSFVQCIGGSNVSIGVGNRTRKMNNPRRHIRKNIRLVNSRSTERKGEKARYGEDHLWEGAEQGSWQWLNQRGKLNREDEKEEVEGA
uniref:Uncharacterized protein n=1 Tax=Cucumis sativus TaxID=3659 RepID=A0A0A0K9H3_CUCSA